MNVVREIFDAESLKQQGTRGLGHPLNELMSAAALFEIIHIPVFTQCIA